MNRKGIFLLIFLVMASFSFAFPQDEKPAGLKLPKSRAKKLIKDWVHGKEKQRTMAREKLLLTREEDRFRIFDILSETSFIADTKHKKLPREQALKIAFEGGEVAEGSFIVQLPEKYKGKKPWPLLFLFHGSGDAGGPMAKWWSNNPFCQEFITVTPTIPTQERLGWRDGGQFDFFEKMYRFMITGYNVDTDRVYFSGFSAGGAAAFYYAQCWPHLCAGFYASARLWWLNNDMPNKSMSLLRHVPGFFIVGLDDTEERIEGFRSAEKYYKENKNNGVFHFKKGYGHEWIPNLNREAFGYLLMKKRVKYPKEFNGLFFYFNKCKEEEPFLSIVYWIKALKYDRWVTFCHVKVEGNNIAITAERTKSAKLSLKKARLFLNDAIVNLDELVRIELNGSEVFNGKVERSVEFLLDWFEKHRDPRRLFWNALDIP